MKVYEFSCYSEQPSTLECFVLTSWSLVSSPCRHIYMEGMNYTTFTRHTTGLLYNSSESLDVFGGGGVLHIFLKLAMIQFTTIYTFGEE
mmetsp:Transcript_12210/g.19527  ORF Transcript_12210/g.19527 Transcript_12210/m.19527 type:complete len:89 (-) Transcript_12210:641-907(-)